MQRHNARRRKKADGESALRVSVTSRKPSGTGSRRQSSSPTSRDQGGSGRATGRHSARQIAALLQDNAAAVSSGQTLAQHHSSDMDGSGELHIGNGIANGLGNGLVPLSAPPPAGGEDWVSGGNAGSASRCAHWNVAGLHMKYRPCAARFSCHCNLMRLDETVPIGTGRAAGRSCQTWRMRCQSC